MSRTRTGRRVGPGNYTPFLKLISGIPVPRSVEDAEWQNGRMAEVNLEKGVPLSLKIQSIGTSIHMQGPAASFPSLSCRNDVAHGSLCCPYSCLQFFDETQFDY